MQHAPNHSGELVSYSGFGASSYNSREIGASFDVLEDVMLLTLARACSDEHLPWNAQERKQKKLIFLDTGLVNFNAGLTEQMVKRADLNQVHRGRIAEQMVGQQLVSMQTYSRGRVFYWAKDYHEGSAEVDFCSDINGIPCGIEVKSGSSGSLKSLFEFKKKIPDSILFRVYSGTMLREDKSDGIIINSIPFYLIPRIKELG